MNDKIKVVFIFGTRPEAIKVAPVIKKFIKKKDLFDVKVCSTGQHKEMLEQVIDFFKIKIDYNLDVMSSNQSLNSLSAKIILKLQGVLEKEKPDYVFVHGDTTTTAFGSIAAFYNQSKICHIEAGLRTNNKYSPFPEEMNRSITGVLTDLHFSPTEKAKKNLLKENVPKNNIFVTGNTVIDALIDGIEMIDNYENSEIISLKRKLNKEKKTILVTGHRRENFGKGFENICNALKEIVINNDVDIVYPVHLNPNVKYVVNERLGSIDNIHLIKPLSYPSFLWIMKKSNIILTDSGGVQEEAPSLGIPVVVLRDTTERPEGVEAGTAILVGTNKEKIVSTTEKLINDKKYYSKISQSINPYGTGQASEKILQTVLNYERN